MELRQLQHFVAVAEEQHFTRAAQRVNIVQSALSTSIRTLEEELDAKLFVRSTRHVRLTAAGQVFLGKAVAALQAVREARDSVAALRGLQSGTLSIGTVQSLPAFLDLPSLLAQFHAQHPGIEVHLVQGNATLLVEKIKSGRLDLAFLPLYETASGVVTTLIACEGMTVVCAPDHWLAGRSGVPLTALKDERFVDFEAEWGTRRLIDRAFLGAGIERHIAFEVSDLDTMLELVARGLGIALVPEPIAEARRPAVGIASLAEPEICWELVVAYIGNEDVEHGPADEAPRRFLRLLNGTKRAVELPPASSPLPLGEVGAACRSG